MTTDANHQAIRDALGLLLDVRDAIHNGTPHAVGQLSWELQCSAAWVAGYAALGRTLGGGSKFDAFKAALEALCRAHKVQLCVSDYDSMQVWDARDASEPIHSCGFEDLTGSVDTGIQTE
jgi:hypothetical protein